MLADGLSLARLLAAPLFAASLAAGGWLSLGLFVLAAASDFADGRLARRRAPTASCRGCRRSSA